MHRRIIAVSSGVALAMSMAAAAAQIYVEPGPSYPPPSEDVVVPPASGDVVVPPASGDVVVPPPDGVVHTQSGYSDRYYQDETGAPCDRGDYSVPCDQAGHDEEHYGYNEPYYQGRDTEFNEHNPTGSNPSSEVPSNGLRHKLPSAQGQAQ